MSNFTEYDQYDGLGLAELIRQGQVSVAEVCEAALERIEQLNPRINAVVRLMTDSAKKLVDDKASAKPFFGVPFLLKDLLASVAGVPLTSGCRALRDFVPDHDSEVVRRFRKAGLNILGKTNTPEFGLVAFTEPDLFGPTRNPWNLDHTPGGSSGGSAAAVAAGMAPMASGGDGGGSIRIPASCCGLLGLKPTRGRTPNGPEYGEIWQGAAVQHVITRSVRDSAAILDATCAPDYGAPYVIAPPEIPYLEETEREPGTLKIAFSTQSPLGTPVNQEIIENTIKTAHMLEKMGHRVEEAAPEIDGLALAKSYLSMYYGEVAHDIDRLKTVLCRKAIPSDVEPETWALGLMGRATTALSFVRAKSMWNQATREMARFHEKYDLYLTPTLAHPPVQIGELKSKPAERTALKVINVLRFGRLLKLSGAVEKLALKNLSRTPFTQLANFTGQPAVSIPLWQTSDGLPCGMHFMAPTGDEAALFRLAAQLEKEKPWFNQIPPLHGSGS